MVSSPQQRANLRVCASCEYIFTGHTDCPKCGFATYGAKYVYGKKAYRYAKTQQPWIDRKLKNLEAKLRLELHKDQQQLNPTRHYNRYVDEN